MIMSKVSFRKIKKSDLNDVFVLLNQLKILSDRLKEERVEVCIIISMLAKASNKFL